MIDTLISPADLSCYRADFPLLTRRLNGKPVIYLDSAATALKPQTVIDTLSRFYSTDNSNVHRGVHLLSQRATEAYEAARLKVKEFVNAAQAREIIFVRGTTEDRLGRRRKLAQRKIPGRPRLVQVARGPHLQDARPCAALAVQIVRSVPRV